MKELVSVVMQGLGVSPGAAGVEQTQEGEDVTVTLSVPEADLHKIDGRDHRTAKALRQVLSAAAAAGNQRFHLVARALD